MHRSATPVYEGYLLRRFIEEMVLAETAETLLERSIHLQACRYFGDLLNLNQDEPRDGLADGNGAAVA